MSGLSTISKSGVIIAALKFSSILEEELLSIAVPGTEWFTSVETVALSPKDTTSWDESTQPPGVFVYQDDATLSMEKRADLSSVERSFSQVDLFRSNLETLARAFK